MDLFELITCKTLQRNAKNWYEMEDFNIPCGIMERRKIVEGQYFTLFHQKRVKYSVERNVMFAVAQQIGGVLAIIITFAWLQKRAATLVTVS